MQLTITTALFLPLLCYLWDAEARRMVSVLAVTNGGIWGTWGQKDFCPRGYAKGFSLKVQPYKGPILDDTSLNGIRLRCSDGSLITSLEGTFGMWSEEKSCKSGFLKSFSLRVTPPQGIIDDTAAENIKFKCSDGTELEGDGHPWGHYGKWSQSCPKKTDICGFWTSVEWRSGFYFIDRTGVNDVQFFCCN